MPGIRPRGGQCGEEPAGGRSRRLFRHPVDDAGIDHQLIFMQLVQRTAFRIALGEPIVDIAVPVTFDGFVNGFTEMRANRAAV